MSTEDSALSHERFPSRGQANTYMFTHFDFIPTSLLLEHCENKRLGASTARMENDAHADPKTEPSIPSVGEGARAQAGGAATSTGSSTAEEPRVVPSAAGDTRMPLELAGISALATAADQTDTSASERPASPEELNAPPAQVLAAAAGLPQQESMQPPTVGPPRATAALESKTVQKNPFEHPKIGLLADSRPVVPRPKPKWDILGGGPVAFPPPRLQSRIVDPPFSTKRPGGSFLLPLPPKKRIRVDVTNEGLPVVPMQAKLKASMPTKSPTPKSDTESSPMHVEHRRKKHTMDIFPGGRGVPSPTFGAMQRFTKSPLLDVTFCSKMAMNRNPFRTSTHKPVDVYDWTRKRSHGRVQEAVLSPRVLASPFTISVAKSETGGLFDSAEGDGIASKPAKKPKVKKKKTFPIHQRVPLDKANFSSPKDTNLAKKLLAGIHDLTAILPMHEAMWLGKNMWIFTIEQLEFTVSSASTSDIKARRELWRAVALSKLIGGNERSVDEANTISPGISPIKSEITPSRTESSNGESTNSPLSSIPATKKVSDASTRLSTEDKVVGEGLMNGSGTNKSCNPLAGSGDYVKVIKASAEASPEDGQENGTTQSKTPEEIDESGGDSIAELLSRDPLGSVVKNTSTEEVSSGNVAHVEGAQSTEHAGHAQSVPAHTPKESAVQPILSAMVASMTNGESKEDNPSGIEPSAEKMGAASNMLARWRDTIVKYRLEGDPESATQFLLSGPIGQLLPELVRLFLETVRITTMLGFFSLKKTEASPLIQYYRDWRTHCDLPPMKGYCLARHLLGMSNRVEKAVRSMPPADYETRNWMKEVLVVLTGSSKDFIVDECHVVDAEYFLNERTKEWSDRLVKWRKQNNLPPLKGSGKVAMVSGWKTMLKEALDVERGTGRVLTEAELLKIPSPGPEEEVGEVGEIEPVVPKIEVKEKKKKAVKKQSKPPTPVTYESGHSALQSEEFLASILRPENIKFLQSQGITNAEQLIACEKQQSSPIIIELVAFRTEVTGMQAQAPTCVRLMYDWTQRVKNRLEEIQSDTVAPLAKKRGPRQKDENEMHTGEPIVVTVVKKSKPRQRGPTKILKEPLAALSANTQSFLKTIGIEEAHTFLQTKTSVIASTYISWRATANMATLKGYGAIATISGWKAQVRKAALATGKHELASAEPVNRSKWNNPDGSPVVASQRPSALDQMKVIPTVHATLLFGLPERRVYVQGPTGITFAFDLTVRRSARVSDQLSTFLTYLGQLRDSAFWPTTDKLGIIDLDPDRLPLLVDVSDSWEQTDQLLTCSAFSSIHEGCGIFDLGRYNVLLLKKGYMDVLKQDITDFLESKASSVDVVPPAATDNAEKPKISANVLLLRTQLAQPSPVFFHPKALEKGQMVELCLSDDQPIYAASEYKESPSIVLRNRIINQISRLPLPDIKKMLQWAVGQSLPPVSISIGKHTSSTVLQRRFHWVATALLDHFEEIEDKLAKYGKGHHPDRSFVYKTADSLLMKTQHFQPLRSAEDVSKDPSFLALTTEILSELEASLSTNTHGAAPSDPAAYCELAFSLREKCKEAAADFVVLKTPQSLQCQEVLLEQFCSIAVEAVESFFSESTPLEQLILQRQDDDGTQEAFLATGSDWHMPVFRPLVDVKSGDAEINSHWYLQYQILGAVHSVAASCQIRWLRTPDPVYTYETLISRVGKCLVKNRYSAQPLTKVLPPNWSLSTRFVDRTLFSRIIPIPQVPNSLPLFLGLVWPKLHGHFGWRLDAGFLKDDLSYLPPGGKNRAKRRHDLSAKIKQERQRKRAKLDKRLREVGFGYVPKFTKRLVVQTDQAELGATHVARPVRQVLGNFSKHILSQTENPESEVSKQRVDSIVDGLCKCFEALLPILDDSVMTDDVTDPFSRAYGCEQVVPMLVLIPSILQQSGLPIRQIEDSISMIKEFVRYISENTEESFDPEFIPFEEEYDGSEEVARNFLAAKLDSVACRDGKGGDSSDAKSAAEEDETMVRDFVQAGDEADLTAFTATTMRQMVPCRATFADTKKKGRRHVPVGYPGIVCRHCWGTGEGKYFFTSSDSLGTAGGVVYGHLLKCQKFPPDQLKKLSVFKSQQTEARKRLKHGAQAAYFNRLWKRLHSAKTIGTAGVFVVPADQDESTANEDKLMPQYGVALTPDDTKKKPIEFHNHTDLLDYIQTTSPWNKEAVLEEAVGLYYDALRRGSRIFNTTAMPSHFSSEWLLARVSPVSLHNASRRQQPSMGA